jgi:hypothetical protein
MRWLDDTPLGQHEQVTARSLGDPTMPHQLEAGGLHQRKTRRGVEVAPIHWYVVVLLRPSRQVRGAKAKKGQPRGPQHTCKAFENSGVFFSRDVNHGVVRADAVKGRLSERQSDKIRTNPKPCGYVASSESELHLGKVHPDDIGTSSQLLGDGDAGPATRVEDTSPRWEADDEIIQQRTSGESRRRDERYAAAMRLYDSRTCALGSVVLPIGC